VGLDDDDHPEDAAVNPDIPKPEKLANYDYTQGPGFITIKPVHVVIVPDPVTVVTNRAIPTSFTYGVYDWTTYINSDAQTKVNGLKNDEKASSVIIPQPDIRTTAPNTSTADTAYLIFITNAPTAANYTVHYLPADRATNYLKVVKDEAFIVLAKPADLTYGQVINGTQLNVNTVIVKGTNAISQGDISYTLDGVAIKADSGVYPSAGEHQLVATFTPKSDTKLEAPYLTSPTTNVVLKVNKATLLIQPNFSTVAAIAHPPFNAAPYTDFIDKDVTRDAGAADLSPGIISNIVGLVTGPVDATVISPVPTLYFPKALDVNMPGTYVYYFTNHSETTGDPINPNYTITFRPRNYIVNARPVTVTWNVTGSLPYPATFKIIAGTIDNAVATDTATGTNITGTFTYDPKLDTQLAAGDRKVKVTFTPTYPNIYSSKTEERTIVVGKATLHVQVAYYVTRSYGDPNPAFPLIPKTISSANVKPGLVVDDVNNPSLYKVYFPGSNNPSIWIKGFVNGEKLTDSKFSSLALKTDATASSQVNGSPYDIVLTDLPNYQYSYEIDDTIIPNTVSHNYPKGQITLTNAPLRNTAANITVNYGSKDIASQLKGTLVGVKTAAGDNITASYLIKLDQPDHPELAQAGQYFITPNINDPGNRLANYIYTPVNGTLTIAPAVLTLKADNKFKKPGADNPEFTYTLSGFVNGQQVTDSAKEGYITFTKPTFSTTAVKTSPIGQYPIVPSGANAGNNYSFNYVNGTLEVAPNRPPTANPDGFVATLGDITKIMKDKLTVNDTDPDQDKLTVTSPTTATITTPKGGKVQSDNTGLWLIYIPFTGAKENDTDSFSYTISDGFGGTSSSTVNVLIKTSTANNIPDNVVNARMNNDGSIFLRFVGITGRKYNVQTTTTPFANPPNWQNLPMNTSTLNQDPTKGSTWSTIDQTAKPAAGTYNPDNSTMTANSVGLIEYTDIDAPLFPSRFYRAVVAP